MTSRSVTARPKTSAGTRATSARLRKPSSSSSLHAAQYNITERPVSRAAMVSESVVPTVASRTNSRIGSSNERIRNRIGTAHGGRLVTGAIQVTPSRTAMRPVTQQGLTGVRTPARVGTGRFVVDKSYYMSLLRTQMNNLMLEIDKLRGELNKGERRLLDCNKIVDLINTNSGLHEIEDELAKLHEKRSDAEKNLAELVEDRRMKEEDIRKVENEIEEQKARNNAIFHSMNPAICDAYEELKKENEELLEEYQMKQEELNELNQKKEQFDEHLTKFPLKQQASMLTIVDEINAEGTPDEQRERLLQTVIRTTNEINTIQKQLDDVNEQIEHLTEELREFDIEMENVAGEKNEKYRELKLKEMQIDEFLNSFDSLRTEEELRIDEISTEVIRILELISTNITNLCLISQNTNLELTEFKIMYIRLQEELIEMDKLEKHLKIDNNQISERIKEMDEKRKQFENIDDLKSHTEQKRIKKSAQNFGGRIT
uniref:Intraflagellar transport protein 74 homolog n=1 Tax=Onchocerca volvulus TaxID=6282 RepID=A0A8R1XQY6_ONCVO